MINKRHELGAADPVAQLLNHYFTVSIPKRVIDDSPGEDEGEIDHLGRDAAVEYLLMPERVKKVEGQLNVLCTDLETMKTDIRKLIDALGRLCGLEGSKHGPNIRWLGRRLCLVVMNFSEKKCFSFWNACFKVSLKLLCAN